MLGTDGSRGYGLEMICADFLAGANLESDNPEILLQSMTRFINFLPEQERVGIPRAIEREIVMTGFRTKASRFNTNPPSMRIAQDPPCERNPCFRSPRNNSYEPAEGNIPVTA